MPPSILIQWIGLMAQASGKDKRHMVGLADDVGAFVPGDRCVRPPISSGRLSGLTFAVKDLYDVAGTITTFGNPDWARTHPPASATATVVLSLLQAGAHLFGGQHAASLE